MHQGTNPVHQAGQVIMSPPAIFDCFAFTFFMTVACLALWRLAVGVHADAERQAKPKFKPPPDPFA